MATRKPAPKPRAPRDRTNQPKALPPVADEDIREMADNCGDSQGVPADPIWNGDTHPLRRASDNQITPMKRYANSSETALARHDADIAAMKAGTAERESETLANYGRAFMFGMFGVSALIVSTNLAALLSFLTPG